MAECDSTETKYSLLTSDEDTHSDKCSSTSIGTSSDTEEEEDVSDWFSLKSPTPILPNFSSFIHFIHLSCSCIAGDQCVLLYMQGISQVAAVQVPPGNSCAKVLWRGHLVCKHKEGLAFSSSLSFAISPDEMYVMCAVSTKLSGFLTFWKWNVPLFGIQESLLCNRYDANMVECLNLGTELKLQQLKRHARGGGFCTREISGVCLICGKTFE